MARSVAAMVAIASSRLLLAEAFVLSPSARLSSSLPSFAQASSSFLPSHLSAVRPQLLGKSRSRCSGSIGKGLRMTLAAPAKIDGPRWKNDEEYASLDDNKMKEDIEVVEKMVEDIASLSKKLDLKNLQGIDPSVLVQLSKKATDASVILMNVATFASCESSVDGTNANARAMSAKVRAISAKLGQAAQPLSIALKLIPEEKVEQYLKELPHEEFSVKHQRKLRDFTLSLEEENLITALGVDGHSSWSQMYNTISSTLTCKVGDKSMGVAQAAALLSSPDRSERLEAWNAIQAAWTTHEEAAAATLNSIIGWRLELNRKRAAKAGRPVHFLDTALHQNRMSRKTLDAMMQAVAEAQPLAQKALKLQAKVLGMEALHPADLFAPPPDSSGSSSLALQYDEGIDLIADCVSSVNPSVGEFVKMMSQKEWIEGKSGDKKAPGAYCTSFAKSRSPRVYLSSYTGSYQHVSTLAHELGHAFHSWVMRDMERSETRYPMNLAETASIFFETVVGDRLVAMAKTPQEKLRYSWYDAESAGAFLLNIPTRFDFESEIHAAREQGQNLTPDFLRNAMTKAWKGRYGDALSEYDSMFWASKLHFHMTGVQFYNFPYTFGYLFALGVYAQQEKLGDGFYQAYVDLLRDTGRMSAEEVVQKHLKCNIEEPEFWRGSIRIIERKIEVLEGLVNQMA